MKSLGGRRPDPVDTERPKCYRGVDTIAFRRNEHDGPRIRQIRKEKPRIGHGRGIVERTPNLERLDEWFDRTARRQYKETPLFSTVFEITGTVVNGVRPSVNATWQALKEEVGVSVASVHDKPDCLETGTSEELVRYAAGEIGPAIPALGGKSEPLVRGLRTRIIDGNRVEATEHGIKELRATASGALPGKTLVVYDCESRIPANVFACEDGHAQERSLLGRVLECVEKGELWIGDRNFCVVSFVCGIAERGGHFVIRQHANLPWKSTGPEKYRGTTETGKVYYQPIEIVDESGDKRVFRRVRVELKEPTRDGDMEIRLISSLGQKTASAKRIARFYGKRCPKETLLGGADRSSRRRGLRLEGEHEKSRVYRQGRLPAGLALRLRRRAHLEDRGRQEPEKFPDYNGFGGSDLFTGF